MKQTYCQLLALTIGSLVTLSTAKVQAAILWDYSPETTGTTRGVFEGLQNLSTQQNFAEIVSFANPVQLTGIDIYSPTTLNSIGDSVTIRIWTDNAGTPDILIHDFTDTISVIDTEGVGLWSEVNRKFADFSASPISLDANTFYWIGMSGTNTTFSQATLNTNSGDGQLARFGGSSFISLVTTGDMAFRVQGEVENAQTTPEPNSGISLLALGMLGGVSLIKTKKPQ
ncbi:hypothetical protein [Cyanothece sp. BG0011]|uniref:hypothetical protein n=1 Tax=Cyanothece sp. BG0011 TaxID=2082950 RepID=UPI000D1F30AA|nr:hypothetical protein [Cyanothece sp. BG0011]